MLKACDKSPTMRRPLPGLSFLAESVVSEFAVLVMAPKAVHVAVVFVVIC